jgi:hypothetical protein
VARWGSVVAAVIFGGAFLTDTQLSADLVAGQVLQISLLALMFVGYALAFSSRWETAGSVLALLAAVAAYVQICLMGTMNPSPIYLVIALPAVLHLVACWLERPLSHSSSAHLPSA